MSEHSRLELSAPQRLVGTVKVPASKSVSNRLLMLNALCDRPAVITNLAHCDDTDVMAAALTRRQGSIDVGDAGTAMRFLTAFFAANEGVDIVLTGSQRMTQRPIAPLVDALRVLGADIGYAGREGWPPLHIAGRRLNGGAVSIDGTVSSQYISALLMIAPVIGGLRLTIVGEPASRPYVEMTIALMRRFGASVRWNGEVIEVERGEYTARDTVVEGDWSNASYWLALKRLMPESSLTLESLRADSVQGDRVIGELIARTYDGGLYRADLSDTPDLAPTMTVLLAMLGKPFILTGLRTLRVKESDRIAALKAELAKLGYQLQDGDDSLAWNGKRLTADSRVIIDTHDDHRIAMAMALAAVRHPGLIIDHAEVVGKSYPRFWDDIRAVGFTIN